MKKATYRIIWDPRLGYAVDITMPDGTRKITDPFEREAQAQAWIAEEKWRDAIAFSGGGPLPLKKVL